MLEGTIDLVEVIRQLRGQLQAAMKAGGKEELRFQVEDLELELQVAITRSASAEGEAGGKLKFWVLEFGGSGKVGGSLGSERVQTLKLRLKPTRRGEDDEDDAIFLASGL